MSLGTLFQFGGGTTALTLTLVGFIAGSVLATFRMPLWRATPSLGEISLGAIVLLKGCALGRTERERGGRLWASPTDLG